MKKMRKILTIAILCVGLAGMTSCNFLDENPKSSLTSVDYYKTAEQAEANVNYLYRNGAVMRIAQAPSAYIGPNASISGMLTGYFTNSYEGQEVVCKYARELTRQQNTSTVSSMIDGVWDECYKSINIANGAIKHIPDIAMSESTSARLIAEAKFFRAFNYFYLVKMLGAVPMPTEPYESIENLYLERTPVETVYALIEADLKEAVEVLPAAKFADNAHRITKYAAAMMLADVYLQQGKYADAATYARMVVESPHKLTANEDLAMNSAFNKLRTTDDLDEVIYAVEYDASIHTGDWWPTYSCDASAVATFGTYSIMERVYGPTNRFLNVYDKEDLRIQPNQFFHWKYTNPNTGAVWESKSAAGCWYWFDEDALLTTGRGTKDQNFFRYAEALLVAAESIAQSTGVTAEAANCLAQVKARADMNGKTVAQYASELQALSKDLFIKECWLERLREFPLEFKIWDDCLRTGKYPVISETEAGKVDFQELVGATNASGATFKKTDLLWPISINEIQRNPSLTQNDGYSLK